MCFLSLVLLTGLAAFGGSFLTRCSMYEMLRNVLMAVGFSMLTVFSFLSGSQSGTFHFDDSLHPFRFWVIYVIGLACSLIFTQLPVTGWLFLIFYICLTRVSDTITGIISASTLLFLTVLLYQADGSTGLYLYFISGISGILFFDKVGKDFKIGYPLALSLMTQIVFLLAGIFLVQNKKIGPEDAIVPIINIIICGIVICLYMQFYNTRVANKEDILYQTINDPEYEKMALLKEKSKDSYYRSLHTAYLTERICTNLCLDVRAAKCAAYYHHFSMDELNEMELPEHGRKIILELKKKCSVPLEKEAVVVSICDTFITTLQYLSKQPNYQNIQYEAVIHKLFQKRLSPEMFLESEITLRDMKYIEKRLIEEKMYYDFIR